MNLFKNKFLSLASFLIWVLLFSFLTLLPDHSFGKEKSPRIPEPIAHWAFDEGSGNFSKDSIHSHLGTLRGATWSSDCVKGKCLYFNGKDNEVNIPHHRRFNFWDKKGSEFTIVVIPDTQFYVRFFLHFLPTRSQNEKLKIQQYL